MQWDSVFDDVEQIVSARAVDDLSSVAHYAALRLGFASVGYTLIADAGPEELSPGFFSTHDPEWSATYVEREYWRHDPVVAAVSSRFRPFRPFTLDGELLSEPERDSLYSLVEFGAADEVAVPCRSGLGRDGLVSFASETAFGLDTNFLTSREPAIALLSGAIHARMTSLANDVTDAAVSADIVLTPMQRECLLWAARGKTSVETAIILGVNNVTVRRHNCAAMRRLEASTITQAVANALSRSLISL